MIGDLISREDAIIAIRQLYPGCPRVDYDNALLKWSRKNAQYLECEEAIKKLPSVKPKIGHWEMLPPIFEEICMCSNCGMKFKQALQFTDECPNCNAIMILKGDRRNG